MEYKPSFLNHLYTDIQPSYTDSLMHHGIKGMHWGVRRYQNEDGSLTSAGKARLNKSQNTRRSPNLKTAAKVAGAAAAVGLAGAGVYAMSKSGLATGSIHDISKPRKRNSLPILLERDDSMASAALEVNPKAYTGQNKYLFNCTHCSVAYDLRRRGYDVEAGPGHAHLDSFIRKAYKNAEYYSIPGISAGGGGASKTRDASIKTIRTNLRSIKASQTKAIIDPVGFANDQRQMTESILKQCESMGPGARGAINLTLTNGMGHCIAFECDKRGRAHLIDSQLIGTSTGTAMGGAFGSRGSSYVDGFIKTNILPCMPVSVTRYDNAEPNIDFLTKKRIVVPRTEEL